MHVRHSLPPFISIGLFQKKVIYFKLSSLEISQICATPLRNYKIKNPITKENPHDFINPRKSTSFSFLIDSGISAYYFQYPLKFHVLKSPCLFFFPSIFRTFFYGCFWLFIPVMRFLFLICYNSLIAKTTLKQHVTFTIFTEISGEKISHVGEVLSQRDVFPTCSRISGFTTGKKSIKHSFNIPCQSMKTTHFIHFTHLSFFTSLP